VVLGLDPSLRGTGYGIIRWQKPRPLVLAQGTIKIPAGWSRSRCLLQISQILRQVVQEHRPTICAVEGLFYAQNLQTALIMGEARGASLAVAEREWRSEIARGREAGGRRRAPRKLPSRAWFSADVSVEELPSPDAADASPWRYFAQQSNRYNLSPARRPNGPSIR
jgi:crossover junction endodeoxyribonuclease RuvC